MKILFVSSSFRGGGITTYANEVVECLSERNDVDIVIGSDELLPFDRNVHNVYNIEVSDFSVSNARKLLYTINEIVKPDVIINSNAALMSLVVPYIFDGIRIINISHSLRYNEADTAGLNSAYADCIIALSHYSKKYLQNTFHIKAPGKIQVLYNCVKGNPGVMKLIKEKKSSKVLRIVYLGGTSAAKSPELVYKVLRKLLFTDWPFEFYFLGSDSPTLKSIQRFNSIKEILPKDKRLFITGKIPNEQAKEISLKANILLVPSRREGCPMAMLEAMSNGTIIITSDYKNACQEMIEDGKNGIIIPHHDVDKFVSTIGDIINNHKNYEGMYDACYQNYLHNFAFGPWSDKMFDVINTQTIMHTKRIPNFQENKYKSDVKWLRKRMTYNKYHMLLFETLKSAIPFYIYNIKYGN